MKHLWFSDTLARGQGGGITWSEGENPFVDRQGLARAVQREQNLAPGFKCIEIGGIESLNSLVPLHRLLVALLGLVRVGFSEPSLFERTILTWIVRRGTQGIQEMRNIGMALLSLFSERLENRQFDMDRHVGAHL